MSETLNRRPYTLRLTCADGKEPFRETEEDLKLNFNLAAKRKAMNLTDERSLQRALQRFQVPDVVGRSGALFWIFWYRICGTGFAGDGLCVKTVKRACFSDFHFRFASRILASRVSRFVLQGSSLSSCCKFGP